MEPLKVLFESPQLVMSDLPGGLTAIYGAALGFDEPRLYANFVQSLDGATAIPALPQSNRLIAAGSEQDRFVMGLLRAFADAILIGAGTLSGSPETRWTAERAYPAMAEAYAELRSRRGKSPQPTLAILSGSGTIDPRHPAFAQPTVVFTSGRGAQHLNGILPSHVQIVPIGEDHRLSVETVLRALRDRGYRLILCEGGPTLLGALIEATLLDELFLTISPRLAGKSATHVRLSLIEGAALLPDRVIDGRLLSVRQAGSQVFLRYAFKSDRADAGQRDKYCSTA